MKIVELGKKVATVEYGMIFENRMYRVAIENDSRRGNDYDYDIQTMADIVVRLKDPEILKYRHTFEKNHIAFEAKVVAKQFRRIEPISEQELLDREPMLTRLAWRRKKWS